MSNYKYFSTTADMGMEVSGENISQIFIESARGMFNLIAPFKKFKEVKERFNINIKSESWEELLFKWLSELLFYYDAYKIYFTEFNLKKIVPFAIEAEIGGEKIGNKKVEREIKAVTFHNLEIAKKNNNFKAKILFDL